MLSLQPLPADAAVARSYGKLAAAVVAAGVSRGPRAFDLLVAATAYAPEGSSTPPTPATCAASSSSGTS